MSFAAEGYTPYRRQSLLSYRPQYPSEDNEDEAVLLQNCRRPSLKEQPSYKDEVARALNRREELTKLKERLSSSRDLLSADPSTKPWMRSRSHRLSSETKEEEPSSAYGRRILKPESPPRKASEPSSSPAAYYYGSRRNTSVCESISSGGSEY